jgi:hypothetical protein
MSAGIRGIVRAVIKDPAILERFDPVIVNALRDCTMREPAK